MTAKTAPAAASAPSASPATPRGFLLRLAQRVSEAARPLYADPSPAYNVMANAAAEIVAAADFFASIHDGAGNRLCTFCGTFYSPRAGHFCRRMSEAIPDPRDGFITPGRAPREGDDRG